LLLLLRLVGVIGEISAWSLVCAVCSDFPL
jgi:hypothetical protein